MTKHVIAVSIAVLGSMVLRAPSQAAAWPVARGSFIQDWLVPSWTEAKWAAEYAAMKQVGMDTMVFQWVCDSKAGVTFYPTSISGLKQASGHNDTLGKCLRAAEKAGVKVFVGLNFNSDWWSKGASDPAWLNAQMAIGNAVADEIHAKYHTAAPHALYGWYWAWEVDNASFTTYTRMVNLSAAIDTNVRHLHVLDASMPVMLSPFVNESLGSPSAYKSLWIYVFAHTSLAAGDIFCPQDCVGAGGIALSNVPAWFAAYKQAVDTKPGLHLWTDTEIFNVDDWTAATLDRFVSQMKAVQPYVENYLTFAYCHYYSPNLIDAALQCTMMGYVANGVLDAVPPTAPTAFTATRVSSTTIRLTWTPSKDDMRVFGYEILRDGVRVSRKQVARGAPGNMDNPPVFQDTSAPSTGYPAYRIRAYDFAGNYSPAVQATTGTNVKRSPAKR